MNDKDFEQLENYMYIEAILQNLDKVLDRIDRIEEKNKEIKKENKKMRNFIFIQFVLFIFLIIFIGVNI